MCEYREGSNPHTSTVLRHMQMGVILGRNDQIYRIRTKRMTHTRQLTSGLCHERLDRSLKNRSLSCLLCYLHHISSKIPRRCYTFQVIGLLSFFHNFGQETGLLPFLLKYCPHLCKHSKVFQFKDLLVKGKHTQALRQILKTTLSIQNRPVHITKGTGGRN